MASKQQKQLSRSSNLLSEPAEEEHRGRAISIQMNGRKRAATMVRTGINVGNSLIWFPLGSRLRLLGECWSRVKRPHPQLWKHCAGRSFPCSAMKSNAPNKYL